VSEQDRVARGPRVLLAGAAIGVVEVAFAVAFATLVFGGRVESFLPWGLGMYLGAAALTLAIFAWRSGKRGVVGGLQATSAALLTLVVATTATWARGSPLADFLAVVAATVVVTVLCGVTFLVLGVRRRGDLIRYVPVPVVGGYIAGAGWVLLQGGLHVAVNRPLFFTDLSVFLTSRTARLWLATLALGVVLLFAVRIVRRPWVLPAMIGIVLAVFPLVARVMGASLADVRRGGWLLGSYTKDVTWKTWSFDALAHADWLAVARSTPAIVVATIVATLVVLTQLNDSEAALDRDLDTDEELRDAGLANVASGLLGGMPGFQAFDLTALATRMKVDARYAGFAAAVIPLAVLVFSGRLIGVVPRMFAGGILVFLGLTFIVEWVWDRRGSLSGIEYAVVVTILAVVVVRGFMPGFVVGIVLAVVLFAVSYGQVDLVHEVAFGDVYRSNVDRLRAERDRLLERADRVQILRVSGHLFFGSAARLLERIRARAESETPPRFVVIDLQHVTGVDASAMATLVKAERLVAAEGAEIVLTGATAAVGARLERGGVAGANGVVSFETDLDRGLRRCEDALLEDDPATAAAGNTGGGGLPPGLDAYLDRVPVAAGDVLLHQGDPPGDLYVLAEGVLAVEANTPEGKRVRLRTLRPGVVVGEVAMYSGVPRTADVLAEGPCVVLRCSTEQVARIETDDPAAAAELHRWLAGTLADRLRDTMRTFDELLD